MKDFWSSVMPRGRGKDKRKTIVDRKRKDNGRTKQEFLPMLGPLTIPFSRWEHHSNIPGSIRNHSRRNLGLGVEIRLIGVVWRVSMYGQAGDD